MGTPVAPSQYSVDGVINFATIEMQILSVTSTSAYGAFVNGGQGSLDVMVYNGGTNPAYVVTSIVAEPTALNATGGASGTVTTICAPGAYIVIQKNGAPYFAAITDTGATTLFLHAGRGS